LSKQQILQKFEASKQVAALSTAINAGTANIPLPNIDTSLLSFLLTATFKKTGKPFLLIFTTKEEAAYYLNDLEQLIGEKDVLFFPGSYRRPYQIEETDNANILLRSEVLNRINSRKKPSIIVSYPDALFEQVVTKTELDRNTLKLSIGEQISLDFVHDMLHEYRFNRVDFVTEPGEYAVRGGIIDVYSFSNDLPYRLEFFGDEVESIRTFDIETQLSIEKLKRIGLMPNIEDKAVEEKRVSFLKYIGTKTSIYIKDKTSLFQLLDRFYEKAVTDFERLSATLKHSSPELLFCNGTYIQKQLTDFTVIEQQENTNRHFLDWKPQPTFNKKFELLIDNLNQNTEKGIQNYIFCDNQKQAQRFFDIFEEIDANVQYKTLVLPLYKGFVDQDNKIACYTDHQIFERYHKFHLKSRFVKKQALSLKELTQLEIGDYVTHIDHGIGKFGGLQKIQVSGNEQEAIKLIYGERDILYLSIHALHKISKYNGKDGKAPKIYKLGSGAWKKIKQKTKARVKHIAYNLIQLYAKRKLQKGYQYNPDSYMQHELEASFMYEDTPDQYTAIQDVKKDMESEQPMDRLICGDVGFGKTEVAIRAAFKAIDNGKQVAILVPTTILAFQHYKTFTERLKDFPVTVDYLNRFRTTKQRNEVLKGLESGAVDIVIGTHQLTNAKIKYKDLGLLIIDEEQKFGVAVKDKLKTIKANVDTLTLTATPIPRTLQFSLMAARDMSVIRTAPPNRYPIETHLIRFSEETIRDAISYEISRNGQTFFIHNRIENIQEVAGMIQRLVPHARIGIGHGQMDGKKLEQLIFAFMNGEFDVLVSTTIIESGLDVPNANTMIINNANNFGLSDLHQMRGRVGRSNKKAFCYFITPPSHSMTDDARKRMQAIATHTELGSGIHIAMKDLEIRGAGDLLGGEQSGFINEMGFDTYQKILNEAIEELKENEFKELYKNELKNKDFVKETQIDTDFELLFPDDYINAITERLNLYTALGELTTEEEIETYNKNLIDRFGELPTQTIDLLDSVRLKWLAKKLGFERIILKNNKMICYFVSNQQSDYYQTDIFMRSIKFAQHNPRLCKMKEKQGKNGLRLLISFDNITSIQKALSTLQSI
jgi:transcription-repair coupling factor (superfamily II helicase)